MKIENCPICSNDKIGVKIYSPIVVDNADFQIVKCDVCKHPFTKFSSVIAIDKYYDDGDYTVKDNRRSIFHKIQKIEYLKVLKNIQKLHADKDLLDFGCGKGVFLSFAKAQKYHVAGVETSLPRATYASKTFGIKVNTNFFSGGEIFGRRFSVITMFHVLEHIPQAKYLVKNLYSDNLSSDGLMVIEVPNFGSWQSKWAGKNWLHIDIPRHVSHFTQESMEGLIESCGLTIIKKQTFSLHLGIIGMVQTLMSLFNYRGFLIGDIKTKKSALLIGKIFVTLPFAILLEGLSCMFGKGGVLRYYLKVKTGDK